MRSSGIPLFKDRHEAGRRLARQLAGYAGQPDAIVLGLPRGGVVVAYEVARALRLPLDVFLVRKLGAPGHEELAIGAIASGGVRVVNQAAIEGLSISRKELDAITRREQQELARREQAYRGGQPPLELKGKTTILVDDGLATGASMYAAVAALKQPGLARIVVAVPTASPDTCRTFEELVDRVFCTYTPQPFYGVGQWYEDFSQTADDEVRQLLRQAQGEYV